MIDKLAEDNDKGAEGGVVKMAATAAVVQSAPSLKSAEGSSAATAPTSANTAAAPG